MISTKAQMRPNRPFQATHPTIHQKEDFQLPLLKMKLRIKSTYHPILATSFCHATAPVCVCVCVRVI